MQIGQLVYFWTVFGDGAVYLVQDV